MIKCKYCSEVIQDDAIKCKHCNEWLNKENKFKAVFNAVSDKIKTVKEDSERKKTKHLFTATEENPISINHVKLYSNKIIINNEDILFNEISEIVFDASESTYNFSTIRNLMFSISVVKINSENILKEKQYNLVTTEEGQLYLHYPQNKIDFEKYLLIYNLISKKSFYYRFSYQMKTTEQFKCFCFNDYIFKSNGDINKNSEKGEKKICNLFEAKKNNQIEWGVKWVGMKSMSSNPNQFRILNGNLNIKLLFGIFETGIHLKINPFENKDIFEFVIKYFLENEKFPIIQKE